MLQNLDDFYKQNIQLIAIKTKKKKKKTEMDSSQKERGKMKWMAPLKSTQSTSSNHLQA